MIFANIMQDKKSGKKYWSKLLHKYRFVIMTDNSFEEKLSLTLSRLTIFAFAGIFVFICFFSTLLLITYTPLGEYIPGKSSSEVQKNLIELQLTTDSLGGVTFKQAVYLENLKNIISGSELIMPTESNSSASEKKSEIIFEKSKADSLLRISVEAKDNSSIYVRSVSNNNYLVFFTPLTGLISDAYNSKIKHFGVDLVAKDKSRISSVLDGTVIISHWTSETGYVIGIQHKNDYLSIYKHNSLLLKEVGDFVNAGDHIAIIGNSGELSSGPHLHFELWHKGTPVNPEDYISF
jgi:murein DD-endopeptidase MepM/ murein hydrolase activator NlpD